MAPVTLYYGHIQVGVSVGEQVGEALLWPSLVIYWTRTSDDEGAVPYCSQVTPYPALMYGIQIRQGHGLDDRVMLYLELLCHGANAPICFSECPRQD